MSEMTEQEVDELPAWLKMMAPDVKKTKKKKSTKKLMNDFGQRATEEVDQK
jgi:hypothetical protein